MSQKHDGEEDFFFFLYRKAVVYRWLHCHDQIDYYSTPPLFQIDLLFYPSTFFSFFFPPLFLCPFELKRKQLVPLLCVHLHCVGVGEGWHST